MKRNTFESNEHNFITAVDFGGKDRDHIEMLAQPEAACNCWCPCYCRCRFRCTMRCEGIQGEIGRLKFERVQSSQRTAQGTSNSNSAYDKVHTVPHAAVSVVYG